MLGKSFVRTLFPAFSDPCVIGWGVVSWKAQGDIPIPVQEEVVHPGPVP